MIIFYSLVAPFFFACVNHLDKYLVDHHFNKSDIGALAIFSCLVGGPFSLLLYFVSENVFAVDMSTRIILGLNGFIYGLALIPYMKALTQDETSTVTPLFLLTPVLGSIFSYLILRESLSQGELLGALLTVFGSIGLASGTLVVSEWKASFKRNVWTLMFAASGLMALNATLYKFAAEDILFGPSIFWQLLGLFSTGLFYLLLFAPFRHQFLLYVQQSSSLSVWGLNVSNEIMAFIGQLSLHFATRLAPVAIVLWISESFQPVYVLVIGILLTTFFPKIATEKIEGRVLRSKFVYIGLMGLGSYLMK